ncbi:MAG: InlB B-repeat-containing protein, partial [Clostridia bacterium]|nr:InlB B-repeat-containing protein [Clostridia bacterium]
MKRILKRSLNLFLAFVMVFCSVPISYIGAAEEPTVEIVSFMRGPQDDLRSSELLEARLSNYSGNAHELTYKWTNGLETYLYLYNSHNMYGINDTAGEVSVSSDRTYSGVGYQWASVYGANIDAEDLLGTVTVEVYDKDGNLICSDSHEGTRERSGGSFYNPRYTYHGFVLDDLAADLQPASIGIFEGDTKSILNLLGESAIVHITCTACSVSDADITAGESRVTISSNGQSITGVAAGTAASVPGDATLSISVGKDNCKFHQYSDANATIPVFVFKKPTTTTAATTLTLTGNFDSRCEYYLDGVKGTEGTDENGDRVVYWTGLTPNTEYEVEVRAKYTDAGGAEKYVYAWVYDTTLPIYTVTVTTLLNDVVTDIDDIHGEEVKLFLGEENAAIDAVHIPLTRTATGTYVATVGNGTYYLYHQDSDGQPHHQAGTTAVIVNNANATMNVYHYSVGYNTGAGAFNAGEDPGTENYAVGSKIVATDKIPVLDGYIFMGWQWSGGTAASGATVTESITAPITLTAIWEKAVNVTVNVIIDHEDENGHLDMDGATKGDVTIELTEKKSGASLFTPTGLTKTYDVTVEAEVTETQHLGHVFSGLHGTSEFAVSVTKSGYDVSYDAPVKDADGNWTITARLKYNFDDFDLAFEVEMDPTVPTELYPKSVNVRIQIFYEGAWHTIDQLSGDVPPIYVAIDPATGKGSGTYPVWKYLPNGDVAKYRIIVTSFTYADGTATRAVEEVAQVVYGDGNYTATLGGVDDGELCGTVKGAYFDGAAQKGVLDAVVTVEKYDVTFDAQGGTVNGAATDTAEDVYYVPDFDGYVPTRASYVFKGWYEDAECTTPATEGKLLVADITLYAKWEAVQTITGVVTVEGSYELDGQTVDIPESSKAAKVLVNLMEIVGNAENLVASTTVNVTYGADGNGVSDEYKFEGLSEEKTYRIYVSVVNYDTAYQNETTTSGFNANDYKAVFVADRTKTFVNAHLDFVPDQFELKIEVDATAIGAGFRPSNVIAQVLSTIVNSGNPYILISQHVATGGVDIAMT